MSFIEQRLLDCVAYGTEGGPTWSTRVVALRSGVRRRNANWSLPLYRFSVIYQNLRPEDHQRVIDAFNACMGGLHSFRLRDWSDYEAENVTLPVVGTGSSQSVQLAKPYAFGSETIYRKIRKPVSGTVTMTANNSPVAATINYTTGIATLTATAGHVLRWSGQFDVPVMFEDDALMFQAKSRGRDGLFLTGDISLIEDVAA